MPSHDPILPRGVPVGCARASILMMGGAVASLVFSASGCARHRTVALPPVTAAPQPTQPATIPPVETTKPAEVTPPASSTRPPASQTQPTTQPPSRPSTQPATTTQPPDAPAKADAPKRPSTEPSRPPAPQISPQLSPGDVAELQKQTTQFVGDAEKNLHHADGRDLNANQRDMVEKIHGFLNQAQEAINTSDWTRARNLSQKAYLLSVELANSLG